MVVKRKHLLLGLDMELYWPPEMPTSPLGDCLQGPWSKSRWGGQLVTPQAPIVRYDRVIEKSWGELNLDKGVRAATRAGSNESETTRRNIGE